MKKILVISLVILSVFIIYLSTMDKKVYYLALGNKNYSNNIKNHLKKRKVLEKYVYEYCADDKRIADIINEIKENKNEKSYTLKNSLIKADLVTINISIKDVYEKTQDYSNIYDYIDELTLDLEKMFKLIRQYCKEDIILIGYYDKSNKDIINYINKRYKEVCDRYNIEFVKIKNISEINRLTEKIDKKLFQS